MEPEDSLLASSLTFEIDVAEDVNTDWRKLRPPNFNIECNDQLLLELYRKERGLWDPAHPDYRSHSKAKKTLSFIAGRLGNGMTGEDVRRKIMSFRASYNRILRKQSMLENTSTADVTCITKWRWFRFLDDFLRPCVVLRKFPAHNGRSGNVTTDKGDAVDSLDSHQSAPESQRKRLQETEVIPRSTEVTQRSTPPCPESPSPSSSRSLSDRQQQLEENPDSWMEENEDDLPDAVCDTMEQGQNEMESQDPLLASTLTFEVDVEEDTNAAAHWRTFTSNTESDHDIKLMLELYRKARNLWDRTHPDYTNRHKTREGYRSIAKKLANGMTAEDIKYKLCKFRSSYCRLLNRQEESLKKATSAYEVYVPKWKWFYFLDEFLRPFVVLRNAALGLPTRNAMRAADRWEAADSMDSLQPASQAQKTHLQEAEVVQRSTQRSAEVTQRSTPSHPESPSPSPTRSPSERQHHSEEDPESCVEETDDQEVPPLQQKTPKPAAGVSPCQTSNQDGLVEKMAAAVNSLVEMRKRKMEEREKVKKSCHGLFCQYICEALGQMSEVKRRKAMHRIHEAYVAVAEEEEEEEGGSGV